MRPPPGQPAKVAGDPDLTGLADEPLVLLARECGHRPARDELIRRYLPLKERLVNRRAARAGLQEADRQDAQQDAVLWTIEAIRRYRAGEQARPGGCQFPSFLHRVLSARFIDFLRHRHRLRGRFPLAGVGPDGPTWDPGYRHHADTGGPAGGEAWDPVGRAEQGELRARLLGGLGRLGEPSRRLWDLLAEGARLREIAALLNLSYDSVKRRRRELLAKLRASLGKGPGR
jgi:RNA polymerase sigma factor (sigma-70 family)